MLPGCSQKVPLQPDGHVDTCEPQRSKPHLVHHRVIPVDQGWPRHSVVSDPDFDRRGEKNCPAQVIVIGELSGFFCAVDSLE